MTPPGYMQCMPADLAEVLARGYLRLTEKRQHCATSAAISGQDKHLDLRAQESPDRVRESA